MAAKDVYIGAFAKKSQQYATMFFEQWLILSAKHGFLLPDDLLHENYNVSFTSPASEVISVREMQRQWQELGVNDVQEIVVLGGKKYERAVRAVFGDRYRLIFPLKGCSGIGYMLQALDRAVADHMEIESKCEDGFLR